MLSNQALVQKALSRLSLAYLATASVQSAAIANIYLDQKLEQTIQIESETKINLPAPRVNVEVNIPKEYRGPLGSGSWHKISVWDKRDGYQCVVLRKLCIVEVWANADKIRRQGDTASITYKFREIDESGRYTHALDNVNSSSWDGSALRVNCKSRTAYIPENGWRPLSKQIMPLASFACGD